MKFVNPPNIVKNFCKKFVWTIPNNEKKIFLTFDDCQDEDLTFRVLDILDHFAIKATFFCTGKYLQFNKIHKVIAAKGHNLGNHGFEHINGLKSKTQDYVCDVHKCRQFIDSDLFRPPYGKILPKQAKILSKSYKIIMWSVLSYDFDKNITPAECLEFVKNYTNSGSVIVFHTNTKARRNLLYALPNSIRFLLNKNFKFDTIS